MNCNLCGDLSSPPVAEGPCYAHTSLYVCTKGRPDNTVHGERCQCHCDQLFCLTHARTHLNEIGSGTMADCFPALSMSLAGPVLTASVGLTLRRADANDGGFTTHGSDSSRRTIALFLSYATPGIEAIRRAQNTIDGVVELEVADDELWPVERLHVTDAFLTSDRLEKIMALATRQITDVWLSRRILVRDFATDERVQSPLPLSLRLRLVDAFADTFASRGDSRDESFEPQVVHVEALRVLSRHPRASEEAVDPLIARAIRHAATAPRRAREQAEWLIAPDEWGQTSAMTELRTMVT